jgi:hypothetical protein
MDLNLVVLPTYLLDIFENSTFLALGKKFAHQAENLALLLLLVESLKEA